MPTDKTKGDPRDTHVKNRIKDRIRRTEEVVLSLKKDLNHYRSRYQDVTEERDRLLQQSSDKTFLNLERDQLRADLMLITDERDRSNDALNALLDENQALSRRLEDLESEWVEERKKNVHSQDIIMYLEAQIQELESMVNLVQEHKRYTKDNRGG